MTTSANWTRISGVLYLIGGPGRTGKSSLAHRLVDLKPMPWMSTDVLQSAFGRSAPDLKIAHGPAGDVQAENFRPHLIELCKALSSTRFASDGVIEGHVVRPQFVADFKNEVDEQVSISACFLGWSILSCEVLLAHEGANKWFSELANDAQESAVKSILKESEECQQECIRNGFPFVDMADGQYFNQHTNALNALLKG